MGWKSEEETAHAVDHPEKHIRWFANSYGTCTLFKDHLHAPVFGHRGFTNMSLLHLSWPR